MVISQCVLLLLLGVLQQQVRVTDAWLSSSTPGRCSRSRQHHHQENPVVLSASTSWSSGNGLDTSSSDWSSTTTPSQESTTTNWESSFEEDIDSSTTISAMSSSKPRTRKSARDPWSITDDWSLLSQQLDEENAVDTEALAQNIDLAARAARALEEDQADESTTVTPTEDVWMTNLVDEIQSGGIEEGVALYDTKFEEDEVVVQSTEDHMADEIAMLVRCNEQPDDLLVSQGRALPPLTETEKNDVTQLIELQNGVFQATAFFQTSISRLFRRYAKPMSQTKQKGEMVGEDTDYDDANEEVMGMDRKGVALWLTRCMKHQKTWRDVSPHDKQVLNTLSKYGTYGTGYIVEEQFLKLYLTTLVGTEQTKKDPISIQRHFSFRPEYVTAIWSDLRNHGIVSPVEQERFDLEAEQQLKAANRASSAAASVLPPVSADADIVDECEIIDWDLHHPEQSPEAKLLALEKKEASGSRSSHKLLERTQDKKHALWVKEGEFVFIDEDSCIGCMQCVNIAPDNFMMLESGRARTFKQGSGPDAIQAVQSCPVSCMHPVALTELVEFETARDKGDGRTDHRHLGNARGHIPVHVARRESDINRRSSWYHTLKERCLVSKSCPQKGCYDCGKWTKPGANPYFKKRLKAAEQARAKHFIEHGFAAHLRKTAEL